MNKKLVIGLTGMPGSGKSIVVGIARENSYGVVTMGDVVREETVRRGLTLNSTNLGKIMFELRDKEGNDTIAKRCIQKINALKSEKILVDGIRSLSEVELFKNNFLNFTLIAVFSSPKTRFKRLSKRLRSDDPKNRIAFQNRDRRELSLGLSEAIVMSEYLIVNEESLKDYIIKINRILSKVESK